MPSRSSQASYSSRLPASPPAAMHGGFKLFGVRFSELLPSPSASSSTPSLAMRKSVSLGNLSSYGASESPASQLDHPELDASLDGYVSDDLVHTTSNARERKKGVPWTEEEHRRFLLGLQKLGKGDWRGISRNFVKTRTPTQVASHAQKYFLRQNNLNKRRRRSSLFDIIPEMGDGGTEEAAMKMQDACPAIHELNLEQRRGFDDANNNLEPEAMPNLGIPVGGFPVSVTSPPHDEAMEEAGEEACCEEAYHDIDAGGACDVNGEEDGGLQPFPSVTGVDSAGIECYGGAIPNQASCYFPFFQLLAWPTPWHSHLYPDPKIVKPTPVIPPATEELQRITEPGPVMKPSPLSYKLSEDNSRQSAFHTMPSGNHNEMNTTESLSSAISVS